VFLDASWVAVYLGQRVIPEGHDLRADAPGTDSLVAGMVKLHSQIAEIAGGMPDHNEYLARYCPMAA